MSGFLDSLMGGSRKKTMKKTMSVKYPKRAALAKRWVMEGKLEHTKSGLYKKDLVWSHGRAVSKLKHMAGKKRWPEFKKSGMAAPPFTRKSYRK